MSRRPAGPVRQHSLQQPPPRRQQQIRRQRSTEDEKSMQMYSNNIVSRNRFTSNKCTDIYTNNNNNNQPIDRPKVRVAWGDHQHQISKSRNDNNVNVEIVARQIPTGKSSSRPTTGRTMRRCPLAEKATFLYSRQELAERLRLAWRQREENKSNIDIFLAHSTLEERSESRLSTMTNRTIITPKEEVRIEDDENVSGTIDDYKTTSENVLDYQAWFTSTESIGNVPEDSTTKDEDDENKENCVESPDQQEEEREEEATVTKKSSISINCNDWNACVTINGKSESPSPKKDESVDLYSQAKIKRANFQSGLNKAFNTPITDNKPATPRINSRAIGNHQEPPSRIRRTNSAPPQQRRTQVNIVIDTPGITQSAITVLEPRAMSANDNQKSRAVKSTATTKRRSKIGKRRGLSMQGCSKDGDEEVIGNKSKAGKSGKIQENKNGEVITMVSLISSADSESETDDNSPRDDKLISELRSKLPTTPIIKSSNGLAGNMRKPFKSVSFQQDSFDYDSPPPSRDDNRTTSSLQSRFVALNKAISSNTVDDNVSLITAMTSWKMDSVQCAPITTTSMAMTTPMIMQQQQEAPTIETPLTDREKRCLAVPIGDVLDKKRKLVRCRSALVTTRDNNHEKPSSDASQSCLQTEMRMAQIVSHMTVNLQENIVSKTIANVTVPMAEMSEEKTKPIASEPYCQTPKEKECWHLYKKMCDKGVFVSFDTVLRGMLTPTEYRLRQKEVSQNC